MDANRLSQGQLVAAIAAIALFIVSFLPWFDISGAVTVGGTTIGGSKNFNLWEAENPLDIYLLIVILVALVPCGIAVDAAEPAADLRLVRAWFKKAASVQVDACGCLCGVLRRGSGWRSAGHFG